MGSEQLLFQLSPKAAAEASKRSDRIPGGILIKEDRAFRVNVSICSPVGSYPSFFYYFCCNRGCLFGC